MRTIFALLAALFAISPAVAQAADPVLVGTENFQVIDPWFDVEAQECVFTLKLGMAIGEYRLAVGENSSRVLSGDWWQNVSCADTGLVYIAKFDHEQR